MFSFAGLGLPGLTWNIFWNGITGWVELTLALLHNFWMSNIFMHVCPYSAVMRLILWLSICV